MFGGEVRARNNVPLSPSPTMAGLSQTITISASLLLLSYASVPLQVQCAERNYEIKLLDCSAQSMSSYTNFTFITREAVVNSSKELLCDMYFQVLKPLERIRLKILTTAGDRNILNLSMDLCDRFLRGRNSWWTRLYARIEDMGFMPEGCPIHPDTYYVKGYLVDDRLYPTFMPITELLVTTEIFTFEKNRTVHTNSIIWKIKTVPRGKA